MHPKIVSYFILLMSLQLLVVRGINYPAAIRANITSPAQMFARDFSTIDCGAKESQCGNACCDPGVCTIDGNGRLICGGSCDAQSIDCTGKMSGYCCETGYYCDEDGFLCAPGSPTTTSSEPSRRIVYITSTTWDDSLGPLYTTGIHRLYSTTTNTTFEGTQASALPTSAVTTTASTYVKVRPLFCSPFLLKLSVSLATGVVFLLYNCVLYGFKIHCLYSSFIFILKCTEKDYCSSHRAHNNDHRYRPNGGHIGKHIESHFDTHIRTDLIEVFNCKCRDWMRLGVSFELLFIFIFRGKHDWS